MAHEKKKDPWKTEKLLLTIFNKKVVVLIVKGSGDSQNTKKDCAVMKN